MSYKSRVIRQARETHSLSPQKEVQVLALIKRYKGEREIEDAYLRSYVNEKVFPEDDLRVSESLLIEVYADINIRICNLHRTSVVANSCLYDVSDVEIAKDILK